MQPSPRFGLIFVMSITRQFNPTIIPITVLPSQVPYADGDIVVSWVSDQPEFVHVVHGGFTRLLNVVAGTPEDHSSIVRLSDSPDDR